MTDSAQILHFTRKRGRPKSKRPLIDTGTPETVMKRLIGVTTEILDLYLEKGLINKKQHWCGIHLRWLYTLRYGVTSVRAVDLSDTSYAEYNFNENNDPLWRSSREKEYNDAIELLNKTGHALPLINLCIYNEKPKYSQSYKINEGLDILTELWKKSQNP